MTGVTKEQVKAALGVMFAMSETIREMKKIPNGELYAQVMGHISFEDYQKVITTLKNTGLVSEEGNVLKWTGPELPASNGA